MLLDQLAIEDEATGTQNHPVARLHPPWPGEITFELANLLAQFLAIAGGEVLQAFGAGGQSCMQPSLFAAFGQAPQLDTQHQTLGINHQSARRRLQQRSGPGFQARGLEVGIEHRTALALAHGAMSPWCGGQGTAVGGHQLVT
ncbi:hypothetical protein D3C84_839340 [compost metagenome]